MVFLRDSISALAASSAVHGLGMGGVVLGELLLEALLFLFQGGNIFARLYDFLCLLYFV
jgi:hypothetical protein